MCHLYKLYNATSIKVLSSQLWDYVVEPGESGFSLVRGLAAPFFTFVIFLVFVAAPFFCHFFKYLWLHLFYICQFFNICGCTFFFYNCQFFDICGLHLRVERRWHLFTETVKYHFADFIFNLPLQTIFFSFPASPQKFPSDKGWICVVCPKFTCFLCADYIIMDLEANLSPFMDKIFCIKRI